MKVSLDVFEPVNNAASNLSLPCGGTFGEVNVL